MLNRHRPRRKGSQGVAGGASVCGDLRVTGGWRSRAPAGRSSPTRRTAGQPAPRGGHRTCPSPVPVPVRVLVPVRVSPCTRHSASPASRPGPARPTPILVTENRTEVAARGRWAGPGWDSLELETSELGDVAQGLRDARAAGGSQAVAPEVEGGEAGEPAQPGGEVGGAGGAQAVVAHVEVGEERNAVQLPGQLRRAARADLVVPAARLGVRDLLPTDESLGLSRRTAHPCASACENNCDSPHV